MSLLDRAYLVLPKPIPDEFKALKDDIECRNIIQKFKRIKNQREKLKKLNEAEFISWYVKCLQITLTKNNNLLIIFQDRLENLYNLCKKYIKPTLQDLWEGRVVPRGKYLRENCLDFVEVCVIYWENLTLIDYFWEGYYNYVLYYASKYQRLKIIKYILLNKPLIDRFFAISLILEMASEDGCLDIIRFIYEYFGGISDYDLNIVLKTAIRNEWLDMVEFVIEKTNNYDDAIQHAWKCENLKMVKYLVKKGGSKVNHSQILFGHQQVKLSILMRY